MARIFAVALEQQPTSLHEIFTLDSFALLQAGLNPSGWIPSNTAFDEFFQSLSSWHPFREMPIWTHVTHILDFIRTALESHPTMQCLIQFICTGTVENVRAVVDYIFDSIKPFTSRKDINMGQRSPFWYRSETIIHPTWPYLCFAMFLAYKHAHASCFFLTGNLRWFLEDLYANDFPIPVNFRRLRGWTKHISMTILCYMILRAS